MGEVTEDDIGNVLDGFVSYINSEFEEMKKEDLESRWFFKFEPEKPLHWNFYKFNDCLDMYRISCRRWEEIHNGSVCVVERVRDEYLIPKIKDFIDTIENYKD